MSRIKKVNGKSSIDCATGRRSGGVERDQEKDEAVDVQNIVQRTCKDSGLAQLDAGASADKMHDLKLVISFERYGFPVRARDNLEIQLDGNAVRLHAEMGNKSSNGQAVREVARFAIDVEKHKESNWQITISN